MPCFALIFNCFFIRKSRGAIRIKNEEVKIAKGMHPGKINRSAISIYK